MQVAYHPLSGPRVRWPQTLNFSTAELWLALHAGVTSSDTYHSHQHMRTDLQSMGVANVLAQAEGADGMATAAGG